MSAQSIEITPSYGIQFGSKLNYGVNYLKISDGDQYGVNVGYEVDYGTLVEASWIHHDAELSIKDIYIAPTERKVADLSADWIQIGVMRYLNDAPVKPFVGGALGLVILAPSNENSEIVNRSLSNSTEFAFSFKAGLNIMFSEVVGLNLQGNLLFPVSWGGVYVAGGPGGIGGGVSVSGTTIIGGFSGGLVFRLGTGS
ncbi:hypothetical protein BST85_12270 [Aureitalea marina]|uniref:Outer membrane protein beta-barrel domain-containing protein n=1 Tax=Aureitalea marina TaxID=930804 RepID=A0A2S7KSJ4_9FLAO|nr:hypothetical protein BST85_12270 [Aureitalea marina]